MQTKNFEFQTKNMAGQIRKKGNLSLLKNIVLKFTQKYCFSSIEMRYTGRKRYDLDQKTQKFEVNASLLLIRRDTSHEN